MHVCVTLLGPLFGSVLLLVLILLHDIFGSFMMRFGVKPAILFFKTGLDIFGPLHFRIDFRILVKQNKPETLGSANLHSF